MLHFYMLLSVKIFITLSHEIMKDKPQSLERMVVMSLYNNIVDLFLVVLFGLGCHSFAVIVVDGIVKLKNFLLRKFRKDEKNNG